MDGSNRQKISKTMVELNTSVNQQNIIGRWLLLHPTTTDNTFFLSPYGTVIDRDYTFWAIKYT